jgi:FlaA1/EpsC-like NDP-sugar epimerase
MKKIMVTGGSGYIGRRLIPRLLERYEDVEIYSISRSEGGISQLLIDCDENKRLKIIMADIRDQDAMRVYLRNVDTLIHLAALKRVDLCESDCRAVVTTNIFGTMNLLDNFHGSTFIFMSTDKAVEPVNSYGATKMVAEKLVMEKSCKQEDRCRYIIVRSGNIIDSTGSVMDIWHHQIKQRNEIKVTHPDMLRFYTTVDGVVRLFIAVLEKGESGKIYFTPHGEAVITSDMADRFIKLYGNENTKIKYIGLRPGERMTEKMRSLTEGNTVAGFEQTVTLEKIPPMPANQQQAKVI